MSARPSFSFALLCRVGLAACLSLVAVATPAAPATPSVALHYAAAAPLDELKAFDIVVVEPGHGYDPRAYRREDSELYAYVSVAEAHPTRPWLKEVPAAWRLTENRDWGSVVIDQSAPGWPAFYADKVIAPLWARGYRGFFLDTLDSYRLAPRFDEAAQQRGLVAVIETLHRRFPGIRLIANRGFDLVPRLRDKLQMVAAESLFQGWDAAARRYVEVGAADRDWLLGQLRKVRDDYGVPVLAIDYVAPRERALARATAERIQALGIVPWVTDSALATLGVGAVEVMPRRILLLYDGREGPVVEATDALRFLAMPLGHLGYVVETRDATRELPEGSLAGRYAGIVAWFAGPLPEPARFASWLRRQLDEGQRFVAFNDLGFAPSPAQARALGLSMTSLGGSPVVAARAPLVGFESEPRPPAIEQTLPRLDAAGESLLRLRDAQGRVADPVAVTPWGGYALGNYAVVRIPGTEQTRWVLDPFAFLGRALALPALPVPDLTTENGRRLAFVHIDGDGFASRAEFPGSPLAARVLLDEVLDKYRLPHAMSVIEGEVSPQGLYPKLAPELEGIARRMFALPHVEIASHTYSHPFQWHRVEGVAGDEAGYHLELPGYRMDVEREILGSKRYIEQRLAPPGKPVRLLFWSGNAAPLERALVLSEQAGLLNLNGGNTIISRTFPSLTAVSPFGVLKGGRLQVYAPIANENVYTNLWTGPFYGFGRVTETFAMTDAPRRLKPVDLYYHTYSASKRASLDALHGLYRWLLDQPLLFVHPSDYVRKAQDFSRLVIARSGDGWLVRGDGELRTLRLPASLPAPELGPDSGLAGLAPAPQGERYVHLAGRQARLRPASAATAVPYLVDANARLERWQRRGGHLSFRLAGHRPLVFTLANASACTLTANGRPLAGRGPRYHLPDAAATLEARCP